MEKFKRASLVTTSFGDEPAPVVQWSMKALFSMPYLRRVIAVVTPCVRREDAVDLKADSSVLRFGPCYSEAFSAGLCPERTQAENSKTFSREISFLLLAQ